MIDTLSKIDERTFHSNPKAGGASSPLRSLHSLNSVRGDDHEQAVDCVLTNRSASRIGLFQ